MYLFHSCRLSHLSHLHHQLEHRRYLKWLSNFQSYLSSRLILSL